MSKIKYLHQAHRAKKDEFYTQLKDIEKELIHYTEHFEGKTILCNCDNPEWSNFWRYFEINFNTLKLKKLIATHYQEEGGTYQLELFKDSTGSMKTLKTPLLGNGDFRSQECVEILKQSDIVVTNPPFSLFREYLSLLIEHQKKFIIIGNQNVVTYKEIFPLIKENQVWLGMSTTYDLEFGIPDHYELNGTRGRIDADGRKFVAVGGVKWFTNLDLKKRHQDLILEKTYNESDYPKYDNYDAINVNKTKDIPVDYQGVMGVPITFLDKYNPHQFELLGVAAGSKETVGIPFIGEKITHPLVNGKKMYARIFIKRVTAPNNPKH